MFSSLISVVSLISSPSFFLFKLLLGHRYRIWLTLRWLLLLLSCIVLLIIGRVHRHLTALHRNLSSVVLLIISCLILVVLRIIIVVVILMLLLLLISCGWLYGITCLTSRLLFNLGSWLLNFTSWHRLVRLCL